MKKPTGWHKIKKGHYSSRTDMQLITEEEIQKAKIDFHEKQSRFRKNCIDFLNNLPMCLPVETLKNSEPGAAELHCCYWGLYIAIQTNSSEVPQNENQKDYQKKVESSGGIYIFVHRLSELVQAMSDIGKKVQKIQKRLA
jgi:hypothetical protein